MSLRRLDEKSSVSGQISTDDIKVLSENGYKALICNRPDGESFNQPSHIDMEKAAKAAGIDYHYLPLVHGHPPQDIAGKMAAIIKEAEDGMVHIYCASGARSTMLWQLSQNM